MARGVCTTEGCNKPTNCGSAICWACRAKTPAAIAEARNYEKLRQRAVRKQAKMERVAEAERLAALAVQERAREVAELDAALIAMFESLC